MINDRLSFYFFLKSNLNLSMSTNKQANNCKLITIMKIVFLRTNIPYNEVNNVVNVQIQYVIVLALGFLFRKSFIVGINHKKVIIPPIL